MSFNLNQSISINGDEFNTIAKDLQGNILKSHGRNNVAHVFIRFSSVKSAKTFIRKEVAPKVDSAFQQRKDSIEFKKGVGNGRRMFQCFALSRLGYDFLAIANADQPNDASFQANMRNRGNSLNDPGTSEWEDAYRIEYHAILLIACSMLGDLNKRLRSVERILKKNKAQFHVEFGVGIKNKRGDHIEHFGYVDGISQPLLLNDNVGSTNNWNPIQNLDLALVHDPGGKDENSFGSYFIFRKLKQDVIGWNNAVVDLANKLGIKPDFLGAQLVGRYKSGTPLIPVIPPQPGQTSQMNDFNYDSDVEGSKCPFHSHIRKTNPRGSGGFENLEDEKKHLFVRRGITYGKIGSDDVGLLFMAYNSDISNQFEFMQASWANNIGFPASGSSEHGIDPVIGQGNKTSGQTHVKDYGDSSTKKKVKPSFAEFVSLQGGEYFFQPSISFLKKI